MRSAPEPAGVPSAESRCWTAGMSRTELRSPHCSGAMLPCALVAASVYTPKDDQLTWSNRVEEVVGEAMQDRAPDRSTHDWIPLRTLKDQR
jgi:hypothetical protein